MEDKSKKIYGNDIDRRAYRKAVNMGMILGKITR